MESTSKRPGIKINFKSKIVTLIMILIVVIVGYYLIYPAYLSSGNIKNILLAASITGLLAIAETALIISGNIDLSVGNIGAFCGVATAVLIEAGVSWPLAVIIVLVIGMCFGLINALLVNVFKFQSFIATLATASVFKGFGFILSDGKAISIGDQSFFVLGGGDVIGIPVPVIILLVLFLVYGLVMYNTRFGRSIYLSGGNKNAARLAGLNPKTITTKLFVNAGALSALAGIILAARMHSGNPRNVTGMEFEGITAAILGGVALHGGSGTMAGCFVGLMVLNCFNNGMTGAGVDAFYQMLAKGGLLIAALLFDFYSNRKKSKKCAK